MNKMAVVHVTFSYSAAGSLMKALEQLGRDELVLALPDELNLGPLEPATAEARVHWSFGSVAEDDEVISTIEEFWAAVTAPEVTPIVWMSRRCARELAGFLEVLRRRGAAPVQVIDVADVAFTRRDGKPGAGAAKAFGLVRDDQIIDHRLLERITAPTAEERAAHDAIWTRLRNENADLRVLTETGLVSTEIDHFDDRIVACATAEWQRCARIVGDAFFAASEGPFDQASDRFLWSRLLDLIDDGALEAEGDLDNMHESRVRRRR